jgi:hypothetical protein
MRIHDRRTFLRYTTAAAAGALAARAPFPVALCQTPPGRLPFEMLALGDSVMWGQGLREDEKYYTLVRRGLEDEILHRPVRLLLKAHSGATILPDRSDCIVASGEINVSTPTITYQIRLALEDYRSRGVPPESVGLVLTNGGINDATVARLLNVFITNPEKVRKLAREHCGERMRGLLRGIVTAFPNALVVVTGYFPFVSSRTDPAFLKNMILAYLGLDRGRQSLESADKLSGSHNRTWLQERLAELSSEWYRASTENLQRATDQANAEVAGRPELQLSDARRSANPLAALMPPSERRRVFFAPVKFEDDQAYAAPRTRFWKITGSNPNPGTDPDASRLITDDHQFAARQWQCLQPKYKQRLLLQICQVAGVGHPNTLGARMYADAILSTLRQLTPA